MKSGIHISVKRLWVFFLFLGAARATEKVTILRDAYGVPHVYAASAAGAAYGAGYAQAEDRLEELLKNYRKAAGTMAEAFGPEWFRHDWRQRLWRHREIAQQHYGELSPRVRAIIEAFQAGVRQFMVDQLANEQLDFDPVTRRRARRPLVSRNRGS